MKIFDDKGRLFGKISIIDALLLLVLIVLVAGIVVRNSSLETTATSNNPDITFTYKLKISNYHKLYIDDFQVGDNIYFESSNEYCGKITDISYEDAKVWSTTVDGKYVEGTSEDKVDIYLTVEAQGIISGGRYMINRTSEIEQNYQAYFYTKYMKFFASVMEIS